MDTVNIRPEEMLFLQKLMGVVLFLFLGFIVATLVALVSLFLGITQMLRTGSIRNGVVVLSIWFSLLIAIFICVIMDVVLLFVSSTDFAFWQLILLNIGACILISVLIGNFVKIFLFKYLAEMQMARRFLDYIKIMYENNKNK